MNNFTKIFQAVFIDHKSLAIMPLLDHLIVLLI